MSKLDYNNKNCESLFTCEETVDTINIQFNKNKLASLENNRVIRFLTMLLSSEILYMSLLSIS